MKLCPACQRCYEDTDAVCSFDSTALVPYRHGSRMIADKYRLDRLLGRGGMGAVYEGTHVDLERPVAIKLLLPDFTADQDALERFRREARAAARLNHPNVADTYDYGSLPEGGAYIVMELVEGETLRERMNKVGQISFSEAINIARQVATGVEAAHRSGITHRDLKPSNIILTRDHDGRVLAKVVDFSVAKLKEGTTSGAALTATGSLIGTPRYMAPEQCADNKSDARSDIYSLGVILYEMLAGRAPFEGPTTTAIAIKHIQATPPPVEEFRADTPPALVKLIADALAKSPSDRPQTAQEFSARLDEAAKELPHSESDEKPPGEAYGAANQSAADRRTLQTNPLTTEIAPHTARVGEPTREDAVEQEIPGQAHEPLNEPPSVQSYAVAPVERDEELETKVSPKEEATEKAVGALSAEPQAETKPETSGGPAVEKRAETVRSVAPQTESDFPLLSKHSKTAPSAQSDERRRGDDEKRAPAAASNLLPYVIPAALILLIGIGIFMLASRRSGTVSTNSNQSASTENRNASGAAAANREDSKGANNQPALSDAGASPSPDNTNPDNSRAPTDARAELLALRDQWVRATVDRDINRLISFYPPVMDAFYLKRNVPLAAVRAEKERMIEQASTIELETSQPEISLSADGRSADMTFRKRWNFKGAQNSSGEVVQELRWIKTNHGWKITSERDLGIVR